MEKEKLYEELLQKANTKLVELKMKKAGKTKEDILYIAPELLPEIKSDQAKSTLWVMAEKLEEMENQISQLKQQIESKQNKTILYK